MKKIYLILSLLFLGFGANAQTAASYGFTALSSPFASISGSGTLVPTLSDDDFTEPSIPIGFTFDFCGTPYTSLSACSNGWVSLSESPSTVFDNLEFFIDGPGWLMPYWDDLDGFSGNAYYQTTGIAPNRIFTFEWNNWEIVGGGGFDFGTFQIKLYETSNIIDFHYGPSTLFFASATMGIANDAISDWQTLSDESTAPTPLLAPLFETFIFSSPTDGQIYRWTPTICSLTAIGGTLTTCTGLITTLTNDTLGGTWSSSDFTIADVDAITGDVLGVSAGVATITYTTGAGCFVTADVTVTAPTPIVGTFSVCTGLTTALSNATAGGTWSSSDGTIADVGSSSGVVTGLSPGTATISYTLPSGCVATVDVTVDPTPTGIIGPSSICQGSTATMTSTPSGGAWASSFSSIASIDAAGTVTGILGGVTTISYTLPTGCFRTTSLTVNPLPAAITGSTSLCIAATSLLASTTVGGTWTSTLPGVATVGSSSGLVTGVSGGTAVISYTLASGCYRTVTVTVISVVAPISGPPTVCKLQGATYTNSSTGGTWSSSVPAIGTISTVGAFTAIAVGTTTISYTLGSGCFTSLTVTVNPNELITGTSIVCQGQTTTMSNAVAGGTWTSSDVTIFTVGSTTGLVTGVGAGTATVSYTNASGCVSTSTVTVSPTPSAITGSMLICVGNTSALSSTPTGGTWTSSNTVVGTIGLASGIATALSSGTSNITYTSTNGCTTSAVLTVNPMPAPITGINVYCPNTTAFLSHPISGGTWSSSNPGVATIGSSSGLVTGISLAGGTATITYTLPASGCVATYSITVNPAPVITGATAICVGTNTTLTSSMLGSTWGSSNAAVATIGSSSGITTGITAGTATITCFGSNGCPNSVVVTVNTSPTAITGTTTVCVGATTTLNSTPAGGAWTSSASGTASVNAAGAVTGNAAGVATITYTVGVGCFVTTNVTVNPIPSVIGGTASVCIGLTTALNSSAGGTWSSSSTGVATIGSSSGIATGVTVGTSTISYILATGCFRIRVLTVNTLPAAIGGTTTVCPGSNVTLTNTSFGGTWSSSTPAIATVGSNTGVVTGVAGGTTTITYTLPTTCIATAVVTVIAAPVAAITPIGDTILCPGDFVTLTSSAAVGATYQWYVGGTPIGTATSPTYIASTPGSYQVRVSVSAGCTTLSSPMSVSVVPATATITVAGGVTTTCSGTAIILNANTGVGLTYQWELGGTAIAGATASTYNALTGGSYTVRVTNSTGCWAVSSPVTITVNPAPSNTVSASGPLTICNGSTVTFTSASGSGYSYQWYNAAGAIAGATSISYSTGVAGSFYAIVSDGIGCSSTTATSVVVVNPLPNVTITAGGSLIFCAGGSVALDAVPGFTYQWYRNGVAIAGATSATYSATLSGGYRVRVTNTATGCTAMTGADVTVTAVATPAILPLTPAKFCWGGSALLSTSVSGPLGSAVMYQWYFNGVLIPGATASTYNATVAGNYSCSVQVPSSCTLSTGTVAVTEMPLPDPPITLVGSTFRTGNYYLTYQWYKNLIPIAGATSYTTPATGNGNYKVAVTDTNGCQSISAVYVLTGWVSNGVVDINNTDVKIFPNPASMMVHVECAQHVTVVISGIDGKTIINQPNAKDIDISQIADGVYMIMVYDENNSLLKTEKLIKKAE